MPAAIVALVIFDAYTDVWRRKHAHTGKWWTRIYHTFEAILYTALCAVFVIWIDWYWVAIYAAAARAALFDPAYNHFYDKPLDYNGEGGSFFDRLENNFNLPINTLRVLFLVLFLLTNIIYFINLLIWEQ